MGRLSNPSSTPAVVGRLQRQAAPTTPAAPTITGRLAKKAAPLGTHKMSDSTGGGEFNLPANSKLNKSPRAYADLDVSDSDQREHLIPVALGGTSSGNNVKYLPREKAALKTAYENQMIRDYKSGKISLAEARANVLSKYRQLTGQEPTSGGGVLGFFKNLGKGLKAGFLGKDADANSTSVAQNFATEFGKEVSGTARSFIHGMANLAEDVGKAATAKKTGESIQYIEGNLAAHQDMINRAQAEKDPLKKKKMLTAIQKLNDHNAQLADSLSRENLPTTRKVVGDAIQAAGEAAMWMGAGRVPAPAIFGSISGGAAVADDTKNLKDVGTETLKGALTGKLLDYANKFKVPYQRVLANGGTLALTSVLEGIGQGASKEELMKAGWSNFLMGLAFSALGEHGRVKQEAKLKEYMDKYDVKPEDFQKVNQPEKPTTEPKIEEKVPLPQSNAEVKTEPVQGRLSKKESAPAEQAPLSEQAKKFKTAEEFVDYYVKHQEEIPQSEAYKKYLAEQAEFVRQESENFDKIRAIEKKYKGVTKENATPEQRKQEPIDRAEYKKLYEERNQILSKKTLARSPEGDIKTHIGKTALRNELAEIWGRANKGGEPPKLPPPKEPKLNNPDADPVFEKMYKMAPEAQKEIDAMAREIAKKFKDAFLYTSGIKTRESAQRKIRDEYGGDASRITDLARNTIVARYTDLDSIFKLLNEHPSTRGAKRARYKTDALGYSGINIKTQAKNGLIAEMQVNSPAMIYAKEPMEFSKNILGEKLFKKMQEKYGEGGKGHKFYEEYRVEKSLKKRAAIAEQSKEYYRKFAESEEVRSRVFERLQAENPQMEGDATYNKLNLEMGVEKAIDIVKNNKKEALEISLSGEAPEGTTSALVNIALADKALQEGNIKLFTQLTKVRSLAQTRRGQEIVSEKGSVTDNSTAKYVNEIIGARLEKLGKNYTNDLPGVKKLAKSPGKKAIERIDKEVATAQKRIAKAKELDIAEAQKIIDKLAC